MNHIPSVDLRDFLSDDQQKKSIFVQSIGKAFQEIGFCAVRGHFLDDDLIKRLYSQIKLFFDLPVEIKESMNTRNFQVNVDMYLSVKKVLKEVSMVI